MKASEYMMSPVVTVRPDTSAAQAARRMRQDSVGCLLVVDDSGDLRGIVTDRDLVMRCLALDIPPDTPVSRLMTPSVITLASTDDIRTAYRTFRRSGVRRLPVMDENGHVAGLLTIDDLFLDVFQRLADVLGPVAWTVLRDPSDSYGVSGDPPDTP
ncbi:CBS domain-containing protein [Streptomyces sp. NBC_01619]|uniref:CBS domain-containing protein n=1 Tax=Streptomyces pratisoli TaxID=3139917 RepID=A0ACC6QB43_9ACTN|nr:MULTISPECIES: CBS domain-containing protein [unclassified Streptomyces]MCX4510660.1 CBS domain-containing protein [Streptomyces sp. NBC_01619]